MSNHQHTLIIDGTSGISGDMTVAALLDLGASEEHLREQLATLPVDGFTIAVTRVNKHGIDACDFDVILDESAYVHDHEHHHEHDHDDHEHHHHDGEECDDPHCGCHHHHHHADEVFTSWGVETVKVFTESELETILTALDSGDYGAILRAKGIVHSEDGKWLHFDFVPEEHQIRFGAADYTGRLCVIGSQLKEDGLKTLFGL